MINGKGMAFLEKQYACFHCKGYLEVVIRSRTFLTQERDINWKIINVVHNYVRLYIQELLGEARLSA